MKEVRYSRQALKVLRRMPVNSALIIREKVALYAVDPGALGNKVRALSGSSYLRLRVGGWRVIMDDQGAVLGILKIGPRGTIYN